MNCDDPARLVGELARLDDPQAAMARRTEIAKCGEPVWGYCRAALASSTDERLLEECVFLLSDRRDPADVAVLGPLLVNPSVRVRTAASASLGGYSGPQVQSWLEPAIEAETDPDNRVLLTTLAITTHDATLLPLLELRFGTLPVAERQSLTAYGTLEAALSMARARLGGAGGG